MKTDFLYIEKSKEELVQQLENLYQENLSLKEKLALRTEECVQINRKLKERNIEQEKQNEIELIHAKEKAERNEIRFKAIAEQAMDGINLADMDGKYVYVNQAFCNMVGYTEQELLQMSLFDLKSDEDKDKTLFHHVKVHLSGSITRVKLICKDKSIIYVDINGKKLKIKGKDYVLAVLRDVSFQVNTEKDRAEKEKELSEARILLNTLVDSTDDLIWTVDSKNFGFLSFNKALFDYFYARSGKTLKIGDRPEDILPDHRSRFWSKLYKTALSKGKYSKEVLDITKTRVLDLSFNLLIRDEEVFGISVFGKDVSLQKKAKRELLIAKKKIEESEQRLNLAAASAKLGIWDWNLLDNSMIWSERMFELYGITIDKFPGNIDAWLNGLHPLDKERAIEECNAALRGKNHYNTTFRVLHPDEKVLHLKADGIIIRDHKGKPIRMIGINRDITKKRLAEEQLLIAKEKAEEGDRLKSAFLANLSHEIRTPMNGILGFMELLVNQDLSEIEKKEFVEIIDKSGRRLLDTIDDIIEMSSIESNHSTINCSEVNLNEVLKFHYDFFKNSMSEKGLVFNLPDALPKEDENIHTDRKKLDRIITNLLKNALKFTTTGSIVFGGRMEQEMFIFLVKDTGIGIPRDKINTIFDRFVQVDLNPTRHYEGSGLGLSIVKELVEMLHGTIKVESELGKGSTFTVAIPRFAH